MGKALGIGIGVFLVIILILGGLVVYSYTQIDVTLSDVSLRSIDWETFSWSTLLKLGLNVLTGNWLEAAFDMIRGVNLDLEFGLYNGGLLPVYIPDLSYTLYINDVYVGEGYSKIQKTISPGQTKKIDVLQNFQKSSLSPAALSIVQNNGVIDLTVSGTAYFKLFIIDIPIPFETTKSISIKDEIRTHLNDQIQKHKPIPQKIIISEIKSFMDRLDGTVKDLNLGLPGTIIDHTYRISAGNYKYASINMSCSGVIQGGFIANAVLGDDIYVYLMNQNGLNNFSNGKSASTYYNSGEAEYGTFDVAVNSGDYYVVMSNTHSVFSTKTVQLEVAANCN